MQNVEVSVTRGSVYQFVTTATGNLGRQKGDYDNYVCLPDSYPVLDGFMDTVIAIMEASFWRRMFDKYNVDLSLDGSNIILKVHNDAFPERLKVVLKNKLKLTVGYFLTGMWLRGIDTDLYETYAKTAEDYITNVITLATYRNHGDIPTEVAGSDSVPAYNTSTQRTGTDNIQDSTPVFNTSHQRTGQTRLEDCHINRHSPADNALRFADGTMA